MSALYIVMLAFVVVQGPFVQVDDLIRILLSEPVVGNSEGGGDTTEMEKVGIKRKREPGEVEGEMAPVNDIYRTRQQKRVHT